MVRKISRCEVFPQYFYMWGLEMHDNLEDGCKYNEFSLLLLQQAVPLLFSAELKPRGYYFEHVFYLDHVIFTNMSHVYYLDQLIFIMSHEYYSDCIGF